MRRIVQGEASPEFHRECEQRHHDAKQNERRIVKSIRGRGCRWLVIA
jgi:hypothetical protein